MVVEHPDEARTLLVEVVGAGQRGAERRDQIVAAFAAAIDSENAAAAAAGTLPRFASPEDPFAIAGAVAELTSRRLRRGDLAGVRDLEPLIERLMLGLLNVPAA